MVRWCRGGGVAEITHMLASHDVASLVMVRNGYEEGAARVWVEFMDSIALGKGKPAR